MSGTSGQLRKRTDGQVDRRASAGEATRERILAAAEALFAERGQDGASIRLIAQSAAVDLAMINYHFGSKQDLYHAVFERRAGKLNELRLAELESAIESMKGKPKLSQIVSAMVAPNIRLRDRPDLGGVNFARMIVREMIEPSERARNNIGRNFAIPAEKFVTALAGVFPEASREDLSWAFYFGICTLMHAMISDFPAAELLNDDKVAADADLVLKRLVPFIESGIRAAVISRG